MLLCARFFNNNLFNFILDMNIDIRKMNFDKVSLLVNNN